MLISEALTHAAALTGQAMPADAVRWLSELDGRLALELGRPGTPTPYDPTADANKALLVPFPWDGLYVHHLAAQTYFANGEYDRYANERVMSEQTLRAWRHYLRRTGLLPDLPGAGDPAPAAAETADAPGAGGGA